MYNQKNITTCVTWALCIAYHVALVLLYELYQPIFNLGDMAYVGITLFILAVYIIFSRSLPTHPWLVNYTCITLTFISSAICFFVLASSLPWYFKLASVLWLIPTAYFVIKFFAQLYSILNIQDEE